MTNDGGPAYPLKEPLSNDSEGMSLRDYFAAKALQGLLCQTTPLPPISLAVQVAYDYADAMLTERQK